MQDSARDYTALNGIIKEKEEKEALLEEKMDRWMYLNDLAEKIEAQAAAHKSALLEPNVTYENVEVADFADLECEASAKSCYSLHMCGL